VSAVHLPTQLQCKQLLSKTQIAIEFAHQVRVRDPAISVFWVNAASQSAIEESYYRIAVECDIAGAGRLDSFSMFQVNCGSRVKMLADG
jgi:hypothetical protein